MLAAILAFAGGISAATAVSEQQAGRPAWCRDTGPLYAEEMPARATPHECNLVGRRIEDHGAGILVPRPGFGVFAEALNTDGSEILFVGTEADGTVVTNDSGSEVAQGEAEQSVSQTSSPSSTAPCSDSSYGHTNFRENNNFTWYFRGTTTPSGLTTSTVAQDLVNGYNNQTTQRNDCGMADEVHAAQTYGGGLDRATGINFQGTCPAPDGYYMVDFGNLPTGRVAQACWYGTQTAQGWYETSDSDIKFSSGVAWYIGNTTLSCVDKFSIESVMSHEAGHAFGMGHVSESTSAHLTMSERTTTCDTSARTLGSGDILGMRALY